MYDPQIGRFLEEDSLGFDPGDSNLYRYVANRPTYLTDPSGHEPAQNAGFDSNELYYRTNIRFTYNNESVNAYVGDVRRLDFHEGFFSNNVRDVIGDAMVGRNTPETRGLSEMTLNTIGRALSMGRLS